MSHTIPSIRTYGFVYLALMLLLALTVGAAYLNLGSANILVALAIAVVKVVLIALYFMHLKGSNRLAWVFSAMGVAWLALLIGLTTLDFVSRWPALPGK